MSNRIDIYNIQGFDNPVNGYVENLSGAAELANSSEENRIKFVTDMAAISRGKFESNNPEVRYRHLLKEAALQTASRPFEFLPVIVRFKYINDIPTIGYGVRLYLKDTTVDMDMNSFINSLGKFGFVSKDTTSDVHILRTNMRAILKANIPYESVPYNERCDGFRVARLQVPMFVFNHLVTHTMLSKESRSDRVVKLSSGSYWVPEDIVERIMNFDVNDTAVRLEPSTVNAYSKIKDVYNTTKHYNTFILALLSLSTLDLMDLLKVLGYPKEIYQRAAIEMRYKDTIMAGWDNQNEASITWLNLFRERGASLDWKNWVQKETKQAVQALKKVLSKEYMEY